MGIRVEGVVREQRPSGLYEIEVDGARRVTAHAGPGAERNFFGFVVGDRVVVVLRARNVPRGRIVKRL
jgi:translation initiation factor IF-1